MTLPRVSPQGSSDNIKKVMRREKNRIAAQKSRMRQTQKADSLHLTHRDDEIQCLRPKQHPVPYIVHYF
ncbi:unnamed protein product [Coregonus sp. 'balchen']|nr:unnamed protein product [Coregonus sp. 'balchen']